MSEAFLIHSGGGGNTSVISDAYNSTKAYLKGEYCIYDDKLWRCLVSCTNVTPVGGTYWAETSIAEELKPITAATIGARITLTTSVYICPTDGYVWLYNTSGQAGYIGIGNGPGHPANLGGTAGRFACYVKKGMPVQLVGTASQAAFIPIT